MRVLPWLLVSCEATRIDGTSGFNPAAAMAGLDEADRVDWCAWSVDTRGGEGFQAVCTDDTHRTVEAVDDCATDWFFEVCTMTVEEADACVRAQSSNPCAWPVDEPACAPWIDCLLLARSLR